MDLFGDLPPPTDEEEGKETRQMQNELKPHNNKPNSSSTSCSEKVPCTDNDTAVESHIAAREKNKLIEPMKKRVKMECSERDTALRKQGLPTFTFKSFVAERKGEREEMQDACLLQDDCTADFSSFKFGGGEKICGAAFYGVFDGHGGSRASTFAKEHLYTHVVKHFPADDVEKFDVELKKRLTKAFKETDEAFIARASRETPVWRDGSTATCVLALNNVLYVPNIGDSKTVLVRSSGTKEKPSILPLSKDHCPTEYGERQRIQKQGGFVRDGRVQGVLEVSRAFGDIRFKKYVTSTPDIMKCTLTENDRYIIMACDGLWKGFTVQEAVSYIDNILEDEDEGKEDEITASEAVVDGRFERACASVASEAVRRGSSDNVTVVLVRILRTHTADADE